MWRMLFFVFPSMFMGAAILNAVIVLITRYLFAEKLRTYQVVKGRLVALELLQSKYHDALRLRTSERYPHISVEKAADTGSKYRQSVMRFAFTTLDGHEELCFQPTGFYSDNLNLENLPEEVHIFYHPNDSRKNFAYEVSEYVLPSGFTAEGEILLDKAGWDIPLRRIRYLAAFLGVCLLLLL